MPAVRSGEITRRNGASAACEPCRIRKLACDHGSPVCARCVKRGKPDACNYHPAPMVGMKRRTTGQQKEASESEGSPDISSNQPSTSHLPAPTLARAGAPPSLSQSPLTAYENQEEHHSIPAEESQPGYLGSTSFFSSLKESRNELDRSEVLGTSDNMSPSISESLRDVPSSISSADIEAGAAVLASFYPCDVLAELFERSFTHVCHPHTPETIMRDCWNSVRKHLEPLEHLPDRHEKLLEMSRCIFRNTMKVLPNPGSKSMRSYVSMFTGPNLRWESIGVIIAGTGAQILRWMNIDTPMSLSSVKVTRQTAKWLADASSRCINFCDDLNLVNDLTLWMLMDNLILISQLYGDASYLTWKRLGDLSSGIFALGLHTSLPQIQNPKFHVPRWLIEVRKQTMHSAYHCDLNLSMFMGRPPRLSSRYCTFESLPLELSNEELALEPAEMEAVVKKLNAQGERHIRDITLRPSRCREAYPMLRQREEILELCLGSLRDGETRARTERLLQQSQRLWDSKRKEFVYDQKMWSGHRPSRDCYVLLDAYLDHRYNDFLLQRVLVQRFNADPEELLVIADELLSNTLFLLGKENDADIDWTTSLYSLPSAGVLALELLKQQTQADYRPPPRAPPRSRIVQNLSVLIAALKWISREGVGNYSLGKQAKSTLERVLERVLNENCIPARVVRSVRQHDQTYSAADAHSVQGHRAGNPAGSTADGGYTSSQNHNIGISTPISNHDMSGGSGGMDGLPWIGQMDFDEAFWLGLEEHPLWDTRFDGLSGGVDG